MRGLLATALSLCALSRAATVFLGPHESFPPTLSPQQAKLVLTAHLGLEQLDVVDQAERLNGLFTERDFVGQGDQSALLLLVDDAYAHDIVPPTLPPSFSFPDTSLSSFVASCAQRASHVYDYVAKLGSTAGVPRALDLYSAPTPANEAFLNEMGTLARFFDAPAGRFAALEVTGVAKLAAAHGTSSEQYTLAAETLRATIEGALTERVRVAVVSYGSGKTFDIGKRDAGTCFTDSEQCMDGTGGCFGHGTCVNVTRAGQECFVCACGTTVNEAGKVENWAGDMCERKDVSGPFVLITGTVITLILLIGGSVSLLYGIDSHELPSILTGGVAGGLRKE